MDSFHHLPTRLFDTQVAAGFAGMGAQSSYESLLSEVLRLRVAKTASFTRWDARPILILTTYAGRVFTTVSELQRQIALGRVRYAFLNSFCGRHGTATNPACSEPAKWIRANGTDVSAQAGVAHKTLWLLPGARP